MSAFRLLIRELVQRGGSVTYAELAQRYGRHYDFKRFAAAVYYARRLGLVTRDRKTNAPISIVNGAECPCCGRLIGGGHVR